MGIRAGHIDRWATTSRHLNVAMLLACGLPTGAFAVWVGVSPPTNDDWSLVGGFFLLDIFTRVNLCALPAVGSVMLIRRRPELAPASAGLATFALTALCAGAVPWWSLPFYPASLMVVVPAGLATIVHMTAWRRGLHEVGLDTEPSIVASTQVASWVGALVVVPGVSRLLVTGYQQRQDINDSNDNWPAIWAIYLDGWAIVALWAIPVAAALLGAAQVLRLRPVLGIGLFVLGATGLIGLLVVPHLPWPWLVSNTG